MHLPPTDRPVATSVVEVRSYELDSFGHANHAVFLNWLEYGRFGALDRAGFPYHAIIARGWGIYVVRLEVDYLREARLGERLLVRTWADGYRRTSMVLAQQIVLEEDPAVEVARARVTAVWVGPDRRPLRVPEEIRHVLGGEIASP
ncbi:MAG: acyl-CoA thioesterase [Longimicrobiales bacterium]